MDGAGADMDACDEARILHQGEADGRAPDRRVAALRLAEFAHSAAFQEMARQMRQRRRGERRAPRQFGARLRADVAQDAQD